VLLGGFDDVQDAGRNKVPVYMEGNIVCAFIREDDIGHLDDELDHPTRVVYGNLPAGGEDHLLAAVKKQIQGKSVLTADVCHRGVDEPRRKGSRDLSYRELREGPDDPFFLVVLRDDSVRYEKRNEHRLRHFQSNGTLRGLLGGRRSRRCGCRSVGTSKGFRLRLVLAVAQRGLASLADLDCLVFHLRFIDDLDSRPLAQRAEAPALPHLAR